MKLYQLLENVSEFEQYITDKYDLKAFHVFERPKDIVLNMLEVPKADRRTGVGSAVMQELVDYADSEGKMITLTPGLRDDRHGTTSRGRLVKFYKRFGFVENKGRNKDFAISDGMYRLPK